MGSGRGSVCEREREREANLGLTCIYIGYFISTEFYFNSSIYSYYRVANTVFEAQNGLWAGLANMANRMKFYTNWRLYLMRSIQQAP